MDLFCSRWGEDVTVAWLSLYFRKMAMRWNKERPGKGREVQNHRREGELDGAKSD